MTKVALFGFILTLVACKCQILGNYRLWDSFGNTLYDFSGSENHAQIITRHNSETVLTDRGLYLSKASISLPRDIIQLGPENASTMISFWYFPLESSRLFTISGRYNFEIDLQILDKYSYFIYSSNQTTQPYDIRAGDSHLGSWRIVIIEISLKTHEESIHLYHEIFITEQKFSLRVINTVSEELSLKIGDLSRFRCYLYEIWCFRINEDYHGNYSNLDINLLLYRPDHIITNIVDHYRNSKNEMCSKHCKSVGLSCHNDNINICIPTEISKCRYGWYNLKNPQCISKCPEGCICEADSEFCIACMKNYSLVSNRCIADKELIISRYLQSCNLGEYSCSTGCCACQAFCNSCLINSSNILECISCASNFYIFTDISSIICVASCPEEYYKGSSSPLKCQRCLANCLTCTNGFSCINCNTGYFLKGNICVQNCGLGYYANIFSSTCDACSSGCISCSSIGCSQCNSSTYILEKVCVASCGSGYYANSSTRICDKCPNNCYSCSYISGVLTCSECVIEYYLKNGICLYECGSGYYSNSSTKTCQPCITSHCDRCDSSLICTTCSSGLGLQTINGTVVCDTCPQRTYLSGGICLQCISLCQICTNGSTCFQCVSNAYLSGTWCYCNLGYIYSNNLCIKDPVFRLHWGWMDGDGTLRFYFNHMLKVPLLASDLQILLGTTYYTSSSFTLTEYEIRRSYGIIANDKNIFEGYVNLKVIFPSSPKLLSEDDISLYNDEYQMSIYSLYSSAVNCSTITNCYTCYFNWDSNYYCEVCMAGYCRKIVYPYTCSSCCDYGFFQPYDSSTDCYPCSIICATCDRLGCTSCKTDTYLLNNNCISECGAGYYENTSNNTCTLCSSNCEDCNNIMSCNACSPPYVLNSTQTACIPCDAGKYYDSRTCKDCPSICTICSSSSVCVDCIENAQVRDSGMCYCKLGYIYSDSDNKCNYTVFHASAKIDGNKNIFLIFDKPLMSSITSSDIKFEVLDIIYSSSSFTFEETATYQVYKMIIIGLNYSGVESFTLKILNYDNIYATDQSVLSEGSITVYICPIECDTCNALYCFSCNNGYFFKNNSCIVDCGAGFVGNTSNRRCEECIINCKVCSYISIDLVCTECIAGYTVQYIGGDYVCAECLEGNYIDFKQCIPCPTPCTKCSLELGCTECEEHSHKEDRLCVCDDDYRLSGIACEFYRELHAKAKVITYGEIQVSFNKYLRYQLFSNQISLSTFEDFEMIEIEAYTTYSILLGDYKYFSSEILYLYFIDRDLIISSDNYYLYETHLEIFIETPFRCMYGCKECHYEGVELICDICNDDMFRHFNGELYTCIEECPSGFYLEYNECKECPQDCKVCKDGYCEECDEGMYLVEGECTENCGLGYAKDDVVKECYACEEECIECEYIDSELSCTRCKEGSYAERGRCNMCPELCKSCENGYICNECVGNSRLIDGICSENILSLSIQFIYNGIIKLVFDKVLKYELDKSSFNINLGDTKHYYPEFTIEIAKHNQEYIIDIANIDYINHDELLISFEDLQSIQAYDGSYLDTDTFQLDIPIQFNQTSSSSSSYVSQSSYLSQNSKAQELHSKGGTATGGIAGSMMLLSLSSLSGLWFFINVIQMYSFLPLLNVDLPIMLFALLASLRGYCPVPNLMEYMIPIEDPKPPYRAGLLGYETSQFLYNSGEMVSALLFSISIEVFLMLVRLILPKKWSNSILGKVLNNLVSECRWNLFIRFFIESYIEIGIAAGIQLLKIKDISNLNSLNQIVNILFGSISAVISNQIFIILFPFRLARFIYTNRAKYEDSEFMKRWGTLFEDIKQDKRYFYVYFLLHRLLLIICFLIMVDYAKAQVVSVCVLEWMVRYK
jgi:hypothetical protein